MFLLACDGTTIDNNSVIPSTPSPKIEQSLNKINNKHTLWKVAGKNNTLYLLGTIHVMPDNIYPLPQAYYDAFEDAEKLVFEIDESIQDQAAMQASVLEFAQLPKGKKLKDVIGDENYAEIRALAKKNKVPMMMIEPFDPWFSGTTLTAMEYLNAGFSPDNGVDQHFMRKAQQAGKPILGLESIEDQFSIFDSMSIDSQVEMLVEVLKKEVDVKEFAYEMLEDWQSGDMQGLEELFMAEFKQAPEMYDALLVKRNHNWLEQFQPMLRDTDDYLVVVGTAHMLGDDGMVSLLENQGYEVEQL